MRLDVVGVAGGRWHVVKRVYAAVLLVAYVGTIVAANWAIDTFGLVTVWPWPALVAPAGVLFAGLAFTLRDLLHELSGRWLVLAAIAAGGLLSLAVSPMFAVASAAAFAVSELADMTVYAPLRRRGRWLVAVAASNTVGLVVDSVLFLWLAFGSLAFLPGQIVGKALMTLLAVTVLASGRHALRVRRADA